MNSVEDYIYGPGGTPVEQINGSTVTYLSQDQLGSTRVLTDSSRNVVGTYSYDAYGNTTGHTGTVSTPLEYAGQYLDSESGLYWMRARYYDPTTESFTTVDPLASLTNSTYAYVGDDPNNGGDPSGEVCFSTNCLRNDAKAIGDAARVVQNTADIYAAAGVAITTVGTVTAQPELVVGGAALTSGAVAVSETAGVVNLLGTCLGYGTSSLQCSSTATIEVATAGLGNALAVNEADNIARAVAESASGFLGFSWDNVVNEFNAPVIAPPPTTARPTMRARTAAFACAIAAFTSSQLTLV
ncbi:MAG: RHS repeat-associated core domain-containing protein [Mycobacterium sp.]